MSKADKKQVKPVAKHAETATKRPKHVAPRMHPRQVLALASSVLGRKKALDAALVPVAAPKGWSLVPDVKTAPATPDVKMAQALYEAELKMAKSVLASAYGDKPVPFKLPVTFAFSCAAGGICASTNNIDISQSPEFASLATLFDEYKFVRGEAHYTIMCPGPFQSLTATGAGSTQALPVLAFDPADATAATNTRDLLQLQHHLQCYPQYHPASITGSTTGSIALFGRSDNKPYVLKWEYAHSDAITGNGGVVAPGQWKVTAGNVSTFPDGTIKAYYETGSTVANPCFVGVYFWSVLFRCRN